MADPAAFPAQPAAPAGAVAVFPAAGARTGVPLSIWPGIPAPARCPASPHPVPCPQRAGAQAVATVITAFSRPADLVVIPQAGTVALLVAAAGAARRVLGLTASLRHHRDLAARLDRDLDPALRPLARLRPGGPGQLLHACSGETGQAALAVTATCPTPGCPPPAPAGNSGGDGASEADADPGVLYAACQRVLRPGGLLVVITSAAQHPGCAGEVIAHARAAGLVYAQHIIALHAPIRGDRLVSPWPQPPALPGFGAAVPPHLPAHSDLLFAQPGGSRHD